ncbi:hypothetical protein [Anaeromyxobacter terrae]|uniref:hypothetical protein n=1 Tax=Anaeromyxobacter terrae TaxID=2925406 RepID=UPI001F5AEFF2|nr:hypothetical protein [Anaeromyxobacter sp. SG22]
MTRAALVAALVLALPAAGRAQLPRDRAGHAPEPAPERAQDRREVRQDRRELARDRWDVRWMDELLSRYDAARARRDRRALLGVEQDVARTLARAEHEARLEVRDARGELRQGRAEAASERRDDWRDDRRDARDDRHDLRDDRRDARRVARIRDDFARLQGRMERRALDRKRAMLVELGHLARAELREDRRELREDRGELRENRRDDLRR